jgi:hypothetical protein
MRLRARLARDVGCHLGKWDVREAATLRDIFHVPVTVR